MPQQRLTTAETLVLDLIVARCQLGVKAPTFPQRLWVKPQLDSLAQLGLLSWTYDRNGDFEVVPTAELMKVVALDGTGAMSA